MPNILEGLEGEEFGSPPDAGDVNTEAGFEAALRKAVEGQGGEESSPETPTAETGVPERGEGGRFKAAAPAAGEGEAQPEGETEGEQPSVDPDLQTIIERHDGDRDAALLDLYEQNRNAQTLIGRQAAEVNESRKLREEFETLRQRVESQPEQKPESLPFAPQEHEVERLEAMVEEAGGRQAVMAAVRAGRSDLVDEAFRIWGEEDPYEASLARIRYEQALAGPAPQPVAQQPQRDPYAARLEATDALGATVVEVLSSVPEANRKLVADQMTAALADLGPRTKALVMSADPEERKEGVEIVALAAQQRASAILTTHAGNTEAERAEAKRVAALGTGSLRPAAPLEGKSEEESKAERLEEFHRRLQAAETTSVSEGLTFGSER